MRRLALHALLACALIATTAATAAASPAPEMTPGDAVDRTMVTAGAKVPVPYITFWEAPNGQGFIKPVLQLSSLLVQYMPQSDQNDALASRLSTLALARFGLEGELFGFVTFRSVFERNFGFSLARNGPVGTSVWEGTAALQARENYLQLHFGDFTLTGGIFPDPASLDFVSGHVLDAFGMDPYVRDPLLVSGFNQAQGIMARYQAGPLDFGLSYTGGNPLTSSLSLGFGGNVSALGTLYSAPLRAMSNGIPGSDIQMTTISPSVTWSCPLLDVKLAGQFYLVDVDVTKDDDKPLNGYNARLTTQLKLPLAADTQMRVYLSGAYRVNQQLAIPDLTTRTDTYEGVVAGGGVDVDLVGDFGAGAQYYYLHSELSETSNLTTHYLNVGFTYWLAPPYASVGLRWGRTMAESEPSDPRLKATDTVFASMRLIL